MIYVRNIFKQDLRDGKQIAFPKEVSNVFFNFSYDKPDPDRRISFKHKAGSGEVVNTRLYAAGSESRIDGELKAFLRDRLEAKIDDILVIKKNHQESFDFELIPKNSVAYGGYKNILKHKNHEVIVTDPNNQTSIELLEGEVDFANNRFEEALALADLRVSKSLTYRFASSLMAKRFLILTGLSGSGKTKLAQAFVKWISANETQYLILPVAADWTNREPLFGYPSALNPNEYVKPESGVLDLIIRADQDKSNPYFLILDEMNLSHVERYFADFLSGLESDEEIPLHQNSDIKDVDKKLRLPKNLFVIGTVNIDETTYMFSPKVLDRANVIEFRVSEDEIAAFLANPVKPELERLEKQGASMGASFVEIATRKDLPYDNVNELNDVLKAFFGQLKLSGAEFGYRSAYEMHRLAGALQLLDATMSTDAVIDVCIMQKLLPKVHGSQRKLKSKLTDMAKLCLKDPQELAKLFESNVLNKDVVAKYPMSLEKLHRMYRGAIENGFTSYAEA
jgi:5-methylcytosine-specific restriction protein B